MLHVITSGLVLLGSAVGLISGFRMDFSEESVLRSAAFHARIRNPKVQAEDCDSAHRMKPVAIENGTAMGEARHGSFLLFREVDLRNVEKLTHRLSVAETATLELRLDSPTGPVVSTLVCDKTGHDFVELNAPVRPSPGVYDLYFVVNRPDAPEAELLRLDWIYFHRKTTVLPRLGG